MIDFIFIIIVILIVGFLEGLIYLIYLPLKKRLFKSGKLTRKGSRRINWIFILFFCLVFIALYYFKDYRTSSKNRVENIARIKLPKDYKVIQDEYQDMWQDYCIIYEIQFDKRSSDQLIKTIKSSAFYNSKSFHNIIWSDSDLIIVDSVKAVWCRSPKGYDFNRVNGGTTYSINFDTLTNKLEYNECAD